MLKFSSSNWHFLNLLIEYAFFIREYHPTLYPYIIACHTALAAQSGLENDIEGPFQMTRVHMFSRFHVVSLVLRHVHKNYTRVSCSHDFFQCVHTTSRQGICESMLGAHNIFHGFPLPYCRFSWPPLCRNVDIFLAYV